ncbi:MAG TPA: hypothetical protein VM760_07840, partial [Sphingomicrobium sp.]|nr:hypothetical protein [Sphingomicrobium sp.]
MKSILMALVLVSAGAASVAGVSFGVPEDLVKGLPRLGPDTHGAVPGGDDAQPLSAKRPRVELAQAGAGQAQTTPAVEVTQNKPVVDESALRYFAARGDTARLNAEIARLRTLYPTWTPPENPLAVPVNEDKQLEA